MEKIIRVAVDGPAGAGKSTVAKAVAKELGLIYLDTGAMYRALGLKALRLGIDPKDEKGVGTFLDGVSLEMKSGEGGQRVILDGEDVSSAIREHEVSKAASDISALHSVRIKLVEMQRRIASGISVIMDGRDIGSFVLPDAEFKFYLDADPRVRAKRRVDELIERGQTADFDSVLDDIIKRDYNDSHRDFAPLVRVEDAIYVDTSDMSLDEVIGVMLGALRAKQ